MPSSSKTLSFLQSDYFNQMTSTKTVLSVIASAAATAMVVRTITRDFLPHELRSYLFIKIKEIISSLSSEITLVIEELDGLNENRLFTSSELYLEPIIPPYVKRLKVTVPKKKSSVSVSLEKNQEIVDIFNGVHFTWRFMSDKGTRSKLHRDPEDRFGGSLTKTEVKYFELSFHKKYKDMVFSTYIPHILKIAKEMKTQKKKLKLFTLRYDRVGGRSSRDVWQSVNLNHPANFETLAMDAEMKRMIMEDLERFVKRKEMYKRVGKAWKRGYLLYGPPGTGKSSLIAAMANYLKFDIYDLDLADLRGNNELRRLLISTENKSILVVEDIDCSIELQDRVSGPVLPPSVKQLGPVKTGQQGYQPPQVTLSGLLNFVDGLWSSCGDERIIVFTTNHKERLDPALLRPGRMDVHIHMSYCTPSGFKLLALNYLRVTEHPLMEEIEELMEEVKVTPAEVGEQLMKDEDPDSQFGSSVQGLEPEYGYTCVGVTTRPLRSPDDVIALFK